jgi:ATP-dependent Clp protease ATP-binding subunit ClpA
MTSNVGSAIIHDATPIGFSVNQKGKHGQEDVRKRLLDALRQTFRPEFLNRVDDIIVFNTLSKEHLSVIIDLQLKRVEGQLADRGLKLQVTPAAREVVMADGYDPAYGARPMRRSIQRLIQDPLSLRLLAGEFLSGETIVVDKDSDTGKLKFEKQAEPVAA